MATSAENMPLEGQAENLSTTANVDVEVEYSPQKEEQLPSKEVKSSPAKKGSGGANVDKRNLVSCKVFLPDGETVSLDVDRKIKGTDLVERIHTDADIYERDFFSIYFIANNQKIFIDVHKPIKDQVPPEMKNDWRLRYGVKFYVSDPSILKEDRSRYNFCLQMCQDIKDNRVLVDRETSFRLTGLLLQASLGDYDQSEHTKGYINNFKEFLLLPKNELPEDYEEMITDVHKAKVGYSPLQAESEFLQICKTLPRYGMHLFGVKDQSGTVLLVGVSCRGITIYEDHVDVSHYSWPNINKIAYKRHKFIIRYHPVDAKADLVSTDSGAMGSRKSGNIHTIKFATGNPPQSKRIWKCAVEQHTFFRLRVPDRPSIIQQVFKRGTKFRYSGRTFNQVKDDVNPAREEPLFVRSQSLRLKSKSKVSNYVPARNSFRVKKVNREYTPNIENNGVNSWVILPSPPELKPPPLSSEENFEEQQVNVKFSLKEAIPDTSHKFVIVKRNNKYEMDYIGNRGGPSAAESINYHLKPVNPKSTSSTTHVSIKLDHKPVVIVPKPSSNNKPRNAGTPIYDSSQIPDVRLNQSASNIVAIEDIVATRTIQSHGTIPVSSGALQHQYEGNASIVQFNAPSEEQHQAAQVNKFLHREGVLMGKAIAAVEQEEQN